MKRYLSLILAILMLSCLFLPACHPEEPKKQTPPIDSYKGYNNIPDLGAVSGAKSNEKLAAATAERLGVEPENVFVYSLGDVSPTHLKQWTKLLNERGYEGAASLEPDGNTVSWYSNDRKNGLVAGYMDTDRKEGKDAFVVFLTDQERSDRYTNIDYESVQEGWSNANNGGSFFIDDKKIYGYGTASGYEGFLSKNTDSSDPLMLVPGVKPAYVHEWDKAVYASLPDRLVKVDTKEKDPEEAVTTLLEEKLYSLQIIDEKLYYTTKNGLFRCDLEGQNVEKLSGTKMQDAYVVGDKVYYRSGKDNDFEHAYSLLTKADTRVTSEAVSSFFLGSKGNGYYIAKRDVVLEESDEEPVVDKDEASEKTDKPTTTVKAEKTSKADADREVSEGEESEEEPTTAYKLICLSRKDGETTELADVREGTALVGMSGKVYYVSEEHEGQVYSVPKNGGNPKRVTRDKDCKYLMTFHDMLVYYDFDDETEDGLEHIYISTPDGFMKSDILF